MREIYKGFEISTFEDKPGLPRAAIRGANGEHVRTTGNGFISAYTPAATTLEFSTVEAAVGEAKRAIDARGIEIQPQPDPRHALRGTEAGFQRQVK